MAISSSPSLHIGHGIVNLLVDSRPPQPSNPEQSVPHPAVRQHQSPSQPSSPKEHKRPNRLRKLWNQMKLRRTTKKDKSGGTRRRQIKEAPETPEIIPQIKKTPAAKIAVPIPVHKAPEKKKHKTHLDGEPPTDVSLHSSLTSETEDEGSSSDGSSDRSTYETVSSLDSDV